LGMGFTLRAALAELPNDAEVVVAELVPAVIRWARGPMAQIFGGCLEDPRVDIIEDDISTVIRKSKAIYDAILLDVDNGPDALARQENDQIYSISGRAAAKAALRPGGILSVWSSAPDPRFSRRLQAAGFAYEEVKVRANGKRRGARHMIWIAARAQN